MTERLRHVLRPHSHDAARKVDAAMEASAYTAYTAYTACTYGADRLCCPPPR